ncbi:MAG TPA: protein kinase [Planctomycetota bacterium]|nr:protein kinase [Planctomycetota bacterium]
MGKRRAKCPQCGHILEYDTTAGPQVTCPSCQASLNTSRAAQAGKPDPLIGQRMGDFEVVGLVGRGGMGAVYKARQCSLDRLVALKVVRLGEGSEAMATRFQREARAAAAINHPNIIEIYTVGQQGNLQYIAMELVEGENLSQIVRREKRLDPARALGYMKQTCAALAKAHATGIVHRDIKPMNILVSRDGTAKVADFGLAKRMEGDLAATVEGQITGTVLYMSPEVAGGEQGNARSDLYSLGATFYHVLAGEPPFTGRSTTEVLLKHARTVVPSLAERVPGTPPALSRIVQRLLRKDPGERFQTADEVLAALERAERTLGAPGEGTVTGDRQAFHATLAERAEASRQKARKLALLISLGAAAAALLIILVALLSGGGQKPPAEVRTPPARDPSTPPTKEPPAKEPTKVTPTPKTPPRAPTWADVLREVEPKVQAALKEERFGDAAAEYRALADQFGDETLRRECQTRILRIQDDAEAAYRRLEAQARKLAAERNFSKARSALRGVLERFGTPLQVSKARDLMAELERLEAAPPRKAPLSKGEAEKLAKEEAEKRAKEEAARKADEERSRQLDARYAAALVPIDALLRDWEYQKATAALAELRFDDKRLDEQLSTRRAQLDLLAKLKARMIERINNGTPRLRKGTIAIPGINADLTAADERQITATLGAGAAEGHPWRRLSAKSACLLAKQVVDRKSGDDLLASALLALVYDDPATAEKDFEDARAAGADVDRHLEAVADFSFSRVLGLIEKQAFTEAEEALAALEARYAESPWLTSHKNAVDAARAKIKTHTAEANAEKLYKQAVELYKQKDLAALKEVVEKLTEEYGETKAFADAERKPTVAEMAGATEKLGKTLTVSRSGRGQFKTIQAAIDAAEPNAVILITEGGFYPDRLVVPQSKANLTLRGKKGVMPVLGYDPSGKRVQRRIMDVEATELTLDGLVFMAGTSDTTSTGFIGTKGRAALRLRACLFATNYRYSGGELVENSGGSVEADHCLFLRGGSIYSTLHAKNSICMGRYFYVYSSYYSSGGLPPPRGDGPAPPPPVCKFENCLLYRFETSTPCQMDFCTVPGGLELRGAPNTITNSILEQVDSDKGDTTIEHCDVYGKEPFVDFARPGKRCFTAVPQFLNIRSFDYRLQRTSPCHKKASDGGTIGCRLTRDMAELLALAFELRRRGLLDFSAPTGRYDY